MNRKSIFVLLQIAVVFVLVLKFLLFYSLILSAIVIGACVFAVAIALKERNQLAIVCYSVVIFLEVVTIYLYETIPNFNGVYDLLQKHFGG